MDFLKRNSGKIALLAIIAFFTLPFIYGNEEEEDFSPFAVRSGMSYQANPISKLASKIASFYGFSKPAQKDMQASAKRTDLIKDRVSFGKENPFGFQGPAKSQKDNLVASSKNFKKFDFDIENNTPLYNTQNSSSNNSYTNRTNDPVKGYVKINGRDYAVIEDAKGEQYVVTPKGHIPYTEVMQRTISQEEFLNAKKRFAGSSDREVLAALQQEKLQQSYSAKTNNQNYKTSTAYKNGKLSNMGGTQTVRVSTSDRGLDESALTNAYTDLKGVNLSIDRGSSSGSSYFGGNKASSGSALRDSFGAAASDGTNEIKEGLNLTPQTLAGQVRQTAQQDLSAKNNKPQEMPQEGQYGSPMMMSVQVNDKGVYEKKENGSSDTVFIAVKEGANSPYSVWGKIGNRKFADGRERYGIIAPIQVIQNKRGNYLSGIDDAHIQQAVESITNDIYNIEDIAFMLEDKKIYIDTSTMDDFSKVLLLERDNLSPYITDDPEQASILLPGPICTPASFQQFVNEFRKQQQELTEAQTQQPAV